MRDLFDLPFDEPGRGEAGDTADDSEGRRARHVYTVSELTAEIRGLIEEAWPEIWVEGEISNCRLWNTGHLYFTLKDAGAQLKAVMWRPALRGLRFKPEDGLHVVARGALGVYEARGEYQLVCEHMEPHGLGALQLAFDQLKRRLQAEGLFDAARKRPLPVLPRKIGVVTSLDGAALRDIIKVLDRRYPNVHLIIRPARVQGDGAAADIARALEAVARVPGVDVIIVGRGGGSIEDLWAFNEEVVARAIAAAPVPIVSAVGHEVDVTIADFVADVRAPTPSAAAEMVVARKDEFTSALTRFAGRLRAAALGRIDRLRAVVHRLGGRPGLASWPVRLASRARHAAELTHDLRDAARALLAARMGQSRELGRRLDGVDLSRRLAGLSTRLVSSDVLLRAAIASARQRADARLRVVAGRLDSLSPLAVLGRGYAVCWNGSRTAIVRDAAGVEIGDPVLVTLSRGELACRVEERRAPPGDSVLADGPAGPPDAGRGSPGA